MDSEVVVGKIMLRQQSGIVWMVRERVKEQASRR